MENIEKYNEVFKTAFQLENCDFGDLKYLEIQEWDSVGHMGMIAMLEETFDILMDIEDIIDFSSYQKGKEILKKYNVEI